MRSVPRERDAGRSGHRRGSDYLHLDPPYREFQRRAQGMRFALDGGVALDRHKIHDERMVHLVSSDKQRLLALGRTLGFQPRWLQYKPLKDPDTGVRVPAWHWDVWGEKLLRLDPT